MHCMFIWDAAAAKNCTFVENVEVPSVTITSSSGITATTSSSPASPSPASPSTLHPSNHRRKKPKRRSTGVVNLDVDVRFIDIFITDVVNALNFDFSSVQCETSLVTFKKACLFLTLQAEHTIFIPKPCSVCVPVFRCKQDILVSRKTSSGLCEAQ